MCVEIQTLVYTKGNRYRHKYSCSGTNTDADRHRCRHGDKCQQTQMERHRYKCRQDANSERETSDLKDLLLLSTPPQEKEREAASVTVFLMVREMRGRKRGDERGRCL